MSERVIKFNSLNMINWLYNGFFLVSKSYEDFIMNCYMTAKVRFLGCSMEIFIHCRTCYDSGPHILSHLKMSVFSTLVDKQDF